MREPLSGLTFGTAEAHEIRFRQVREAFVRHQRMSLPVPDGGIEPLHVHIGEQGGQRSAMARKIRA